MGGDVIEGVRHAADAMQEDQRRLSGRAPVEVMNSQAVDGDVTVDGLRLGRARKRHEHQPQEAQNSCGHLFAVRPISSRRSAAVLSCGLLALPSNPTPPASPIATSSGVNPRLSLTSSFAPRSARNRTT